ncbi:MAG: ABC transporter ATP-binding protein [Spirochaetes bacterium]|nr:MAG: ABC transporter ATP-binding protein [Spirochaetota bacterium]
MIKINNLYFKYTGNWLFNNLRLEIKTGNIYGLLGKNGAGKTTLLKIITGQLFPKEGNCKIYDIDSRKRLPDILSKIYFLPEDFHLPDLTPIKYSKVFSPFYPNFSSEDFKKHLSDFEIESGKSLSLMSYGQKKKFLIAFGASTNCEIILLDEPTNGLDIPSKTQFRRLISSIVNNERLIMISTHQVRDMEQLIDPIIIIDNGKIILNESIESITSKISMVLSPEDISAPDIIYKEKVPGGYAIVYEKPGPTLNIDIEILFNTVLANKEKLKSIFNGSSYEIGAKK